MPENIPVATIGFKTIEQWSAWAAFYVVVGTFIITIIGVFISCLFLYLSVRQYAQVKKAEAEASKTKMNQQRFDNAFKLIDLLAGDKHNHYSDLAALEALIEYPEYYPAYEYMRTNYEGFGDTPGIIAERAALVRLTNHTKPIFEAMIKSRSHSIK